MTKPDYSRFYEADALTCLKKARRLLLRVLYRQTVVLLIWLAVGVGCFFLTYVSVKALLNFLQNQESLLEKIFSLSDLYLANSWLFGILLFLWILLILYCPLTGVLGIYNAVKYYPAFCRDKEDDAQADDALFVPEDNPELHKVVEDVGKKLGVRNPLPDNLLKTDKPMYYRMFSVAEFKAYVGTELIWHSSLSNGMYLDFARLSSLVLKRILRPSWKDYDEREESKSWLPKFVTDWDWIIGRWIFNTYKSSQEEAVAVEFTMAKAWHYLSLLGYVHLASCFGTEVVKSIAIKKYWFDRIFARFRNLLDRYSIPEVSLLRAFKDYIHHMENVYGVVAPPGYYILEPLFPRLNLEACCIRINALRHRAAHFGYLYPDNITDADICKLLDEAPFVSADEVNQLWEETKSADYLFRESFDDMFEKWAADAPFGEIHYMVSYQEFLSKLESVPNWLNVFFSGPLFRMALEKLDNPDENLSEYQMELLAGDVFSLESACDLQRWNQINKDCLWLKDEYSPLGKNSDKCFCGNREDGLEDMLFIEGEYFSRDSIPWEKVNKIFADRLLKAMDRSCACVKVMEEYSELDEEWSRKWEEHKNNVRLSAEFENRCPKAEIPGDEDMDALEKFCWDYIVSDLPPERNPIAKWYNPHAENNDLVSLVGEFLDTGRNRALYFLCHARIEEMLDKECSASHKALIEEVLWPIIKWKIYA